MEWCLRNGRKHTCDWTTLSRNGRVANAGWHGLGEVEEIYTWHRTGEWRRSVCGVGDAVELDRRSGHGSMLSVKRSDSDGVQSSSDDSEREAMHDGDALLKAHYHRLSRPYRRSFAEKENRSTHSRSAATPDATRRKWSSLVHPLS